MVQRCSWACTNNDNNDANRWTKAWSLSVLYSIHLLDGTSMFWSFDTGQNKLSAGQYHMTILWAQV